MPLQPPEYCALIFTIPRTYAKIVCVVRGQPGGGQWLRLKTARVDARTLTWHGLVDAVGLLPIAISEAMDYDYPINGTST